MIVIPYWVLAVLGAAMIAITADFLFRRRSIETPFIITLLYAILATVGCILILHGCDPYIRTIDFQALLMNSPPIGFVL